MNEEQVGENVSRIIGKYEGLGETLYFVEYEIENSDGEYKLKVYLQNSRGGEVIIVDTDNQDVANLKFVQELMRIHTEVVQEIVRNE